MSQSTNPQPRRPDLYSAGTGGERSHRILARLELGGQLPPASRDRLSGSMARALLAALAALLAIAAAAWMLVHAAPLRQDKEVAAGALPMAPVLTQQEVERRAAAIINEPLQAHAVRSARPPGAPAPAASGAVRQAPAARQPRPKPSPRPKDNDKDAKLLAAVLEHAGRPQPPATPPGD